MVKFEKLPGFRDFYPEPLPPKENWSAAVRGYIFETWRRVACRYGFVEYDGPPLEQLELYKAKSGDEIIGQLYCFEDRGGRWIALRPEMTPTLARMVSAIEPHYKKPLKWYAIPQLFRYERQQKGRLREHFQFNADIIGESSRSADAELIALLIDILRDFGFTEMDVEVRLSSRKAWEDFYLSHGGKPEKAYTFYQTVDKLDREPEEQSAKKLQELGFSLEGVRLFISECKPTDDIELILKELQWRGLGGFVRIDYGVIRGLAYYTGPVFEAFDKYGRFRAIAGGGRYDNLLKLISGGKVDLPAVGFGMGDVVLTELLKEKMLLPKFRSLLDVFILIEDEVFRPRSLSLVQRLRDSGLSVDYALGPNKSDRQYKFALDRGARFTVRYWRDSSTGEVLLKVKNIALKMEEVVAETNVVEYIKSKLHK